MLYIGVDLGTSAVKLLLMDSDGKIQNIVSKEYPLYFPHPGWSEQKPEDWWEQTKIGIKELIKDADKSQVAGISFGGQMHGLVILDKDDNVIRPAILWNDGRTYEECDYLNNVIGKEKLSEYTANISFTGFTAPKILWVKNKEPENFAKIEKIMLPKDLTSGEEAEPREKKLEELSPADYSDYVLVKQVQLVKDDGIWAVSEDGNVRVRMWNKFMDMSILLKNYDGKYFDVYAIYGTDVLDGSVINELYMVKTPVEVEAPTAINEVRWKIDEGSGDLYNLNGQRVDQQYKGLVIRNGRGVLNK